MLWLVALLTSKRLKICYVVPGHDLVSTVGPTRNVLSLAKALSRWADVSVAFRKAIEPEKAQGLRLLEIQPDAVVPKRLVDDASTRGMSIPQFGKFLIDIHEFSRERLRPYDVIFEKSWMLSGFVSNICRRQGQAAIPVENYVPNPAHAAGGDMMKRLRIRSADIWAGHLLRRSQLIIAETPGLKSGISHHWRVPRDRIEVVALGVDRDLFSGSDQAESRRQLALSQGSLIMLYVGTLDATHDLEPLIKALQHDYPKDVEVHIVGDGWRQDSYRELARQSRCPVTFHGRIPHGSVPKYINAADVCLAPYDASAFKNEELGYSTMKIPEYLSVGRPVIAVGSDRTRELIQDKRNGFLFDNTVDRWREFLQDMPTRAHLAQMALATKQAPLMSWEDTARRYLDLSISLLQHTTAIGR